MKPLERLIQNAEFWEAKDKERSLYFYNEAFKFATTIEEKLVIDQKIHLMLRDHEIADGVIERSSIENNLKEVM